MEEEFDDNVGGLADKKERKTAREGTQEPLKKTARRGNPSTQERNSQGEDPRTLGRKQ